MKPRKSSQSSDFLGPENPKRFSRKEVVAVSLVVLSLFLISLASACLMEDWRFALSIGNLNVDTAKLEQLCTQETCIISNDFITIKSHYDERISVIIGKTDSIVGFKGITIRVPYAYTKANTIIQGDIIPESYNWKESVKTDFTFLKQAGVLNIDGAEIDKISNLSSNGKSILSCENELKQLSAGCTCDEKGNVACVKLLCKETVIETSLPSALLSLETNVPETSKSSNAIYYVIAVILIVAIILVAWIYMSKKKPEKEKK